MGNFTIAAFLLVLCSLNARSQSITKYVFAASSGTFTPITSTALHGTGVGNSDEGYYNSVPIGFDFYYMGARYTSISVSTNGWLTLGVDITNAAYVNNLSTGGSPRPIIAPLWDDLDM